MFKKKKPSIVKDTKPKKVKSGGSEEKSNIFTIMLFTFVAIAVFVLTWLTFSAVFKTETYYMINTPVAARQEITPSMLTAQETSVGTAPQNAMSMEDVQRGGMYARYPLSPGDVLSRSNAGPLALTSDGIPDDWSITSFDVSSGSAIGGALMRGDFIDILGVDEEEGARYVFNNVLILEASYSVEDADPEDESKGNVIIRYTVGMPAEDVAILHHSHALYGELLVTKAPSSVLYAGRNTDTLGKTFKFGDTVLNKDLYEGADPTFTPVVRDENQRPVNRNTCAMNEVSPSTLCTDLGFSIGVAEDTQTEAPEAPVVEETPETPEVNDGQE